MRSGTELRNVCQQNLFMLLMPEHVNAFLRCIKWPLNARLSQLMAGESYTQPITLKTRTETALKKAAGRREFQRGILSSDESGAPVVVTTGGQGSGILRSMNMANCYIVLPESSTGASVSGHAF